MKGAHLPEISAELILLVLHAEHGVEGRDDRALGSGLAAELLGMSSVGFNALVYDTIRDIRMILPAVNIRANAVVINKRLAVFRHSPEGRVHGTQRRSHLGEEDFELLVLARFGGIETVVQNGYRRSGFPLDLHVNQNEPFLVDTAEKILDQSEVAAFDFA